MLYIIILSISNLLYNKKSIIIILFNYLYFIINFLFKFILKLIKYNINNYIINFK